MLVARLKVSNTKVLHHHPGVFNPWDVALCGHDLTGDEDLGWGTAKKREGQVTCQDCARLMHVLSKVKREDYVLARSTPQH